MTIQNTTTTTTTPETLSQHMHTTVEHAQIITRTILRTMARGTQKQANSGSLSTDSHAPNMIRELRIGLLNDARIAAKQHAVDTIGTPIYNLPNKDAQRTAKYFAGVSLDAVIDDFAAYEDQVTDIADSFSDSQDIVNECVVAICESMNVLDHDTPYALTLDALKACYKRANAYIYGQKKRPASKHVFLDEVIQYKAYENEKSYDVVRVPEYVDIDTYSDYNGYMDAYTRLMQALTIPQREIFKYLAKGYSQKKISFRVYGDTSKNHLVLVNQKVALIRSTAFRVLDADITRMFEKRDRKAYQKLDTLRDVQIAK